MDQHSVEAQDHFYDARSHGTSSVSMSRENSLTAMLPQSPSSAGDGRPACDGARLNTYQVTSLEPTGSGNSVKSADMLAGAAQAPSQQPAASDAMELDAKASAAPTSTPSPPTIPDDPSIDPLEGDVVPLGSISPLSGDPQLLCNGAGASNATAAPPLAGDASLLSLGDDVGVSASDPFAAASPEPVLATDDASEAWGTPQGDKEVSESNQADDYAHSAERDGTEAQTAPGGKPAVPAVSLNSLSLKDLSHAPDAQAPLLSPVRNISGTLEDAIAQDNAGLFGGLQMGGDADNSNVAPPAAEPMPANASASTSDPSAASPPSSSPPLAPSSPAKAAAPDTLATRPLTVRTASPSRTTAPKSSGIAAVSSTEATSGSVRLPVSVPVRLFAHLWLPSPAAPVPLVIHPPAPVSGLPSQAFSHGIALVHVCIFSAPTPPQLYLRTPTSLLAFTL